MPAAAPTVPGTQRLVGVAQTSLVGAGLTRLLNKINGLMGWFAGPLCLRRCPSKVGADAGALGKCLRKRERRVRRGIPCVARFKPRRLR